MSSTLEWKEAWLIMTAPLPSSTAVMRILMKKLRFREVKQHTKIIH
jgi:hypothetical protein